MSATEASGVSAADAGGATTRTAPHPVRVGVLIAGAVLEGGTPGRLLGVACLGKLVFDAATGSTSALLPQGIEVTWAAHLGGLLIGIALAVAFRLQRRSTQ